MTFYEKNKKILLILIGIASFFFLLSFFLTPITTNDFWIQLKVGQLIKQNFEIPKTIIFSFTPEKNNLFVAHEWLSSLIFAIFYDSFGHNFMIFFKFLIFAFCFYLSYILAFRITKNPLTSFFISIFCLFTVNYRSFLRPESFAYLLFLSQLNLLWLYQENKNLKYLLYYTFVHIVWVNSHGSFFISMGLPGLLAAANFTDKFFGNFILNKKENLIETKDIRLGLASFACLFASLINPLGYTLITHSYELSQNSLLKKTIFEWHPMLSQSVMRTSIFTVFLIFASILSAILLFRFMKLRTFSLTLLFIFSYLALDAQRHLSFLALASVWPMSLMLKDIKEKSHFSTFFSFSLLACLFSLCLYSYKKGNTILKKPGFYHDAKFSEETLDYIKSRNLSGNTLNTYSLGGQLLFNFYPQIKIGIDSRVDSYGVRYADSYRRLIQGKPEPLKEFIKVHNVKNIIVTPSDFRIMRDKGSYKSLVDEGWAFIHHKSNVVILRNM